MNPLFYVKDTNKFSKYFGHVLPVLAVSNQKLLLVDDDNCLFWDNAHGLIVVSKLEKVLK